MACPRDLVSGIESPMKDRALLEQRRQELVKAATEVFLERGFGNTSVNEIADRCGWSIGALYKYVGSKDDILLLVCAEIAGRMRREHLLSDLQGTPVDRFRQAYSSYCDIFTVKGHEALLFYREFGNISRERRHRFISDEADVIDFFRQLVEEGIQQGVFRCDDPHLFAVDCIARAHGLSLKAWAIADRDPIVVRNQIVRWALTVVGVEDAVRTPSTRVAATRRGGSVARTPRRAVAQAPATRRSRPTQ